MGQSNFQVFVIQILIRYSGAQPLVSHFNSSGLSDDENTDFSLQLTPTNKVLFFMGNGNPNDIQSLSAQSGILLSSESTLILGTWNHIAVAVEASSAGIRGRLYVNGVQEAEYVWVLFGSRQWSPDPIYVGFYNNIEAGAQYFTGYLDELRFWNTFLYPLEVQWYMNLKTPDAAGLVSYYQMDEGAGTIWIDSRSGYNGEGTNIIWASAGVPFNSFYSIPTTPRQFTIITLVGSDSLSNPVFYEISTLPKHGDLFTVDNEGTVNKLITGAPFTLSNSQVAYVWKQEFSEVIDSFVYNVALSSAVEIYSSARVTVQVTSSPSCLPIPGAQLDSCGVCAGDDSSCQCIWGPGFYKGYEISELDQIMAFYNAKSTLELLNNLYSSMGAAVSIMDTCRENGGTLPITEAAETLAVLKDFENLCLKKLTSLANKLTE